MRKLEIPKGINVRGHQWSVYLDSTAPKDLKGKLPQGDYGVCCYSAKAIILASWQTQDELEETFIHEVLHALLEDDEMLGPDLEHHVIETIEAPLMRVLRQLTYKEAT